MKKVKYPAKRSYSLRRDSFVGSAQAEIERVFGLPSGYVILVLPNSRRARSDKYIGSLLDDWDYEN